MLFIGAANRDPTQFLDPDRFDLNRKASRPMTFGHGPHQCVGQLLGRMQMEIAMETALRRLPGLALDTLDPERKPAMSGGLPSLHAHW